MTQENKIKIIQLLAEGFTTIQISRLIRYSTRTIETICAGLVKEHKCKNRTHLVAYFLRNKIIK